jgi:hypothetical protein
MFEKFHSKSMTATLAALVAALGVGGVAMAQNSGSSPSSTPPAAQTPQSSTPSVDKPTPGDTADTGAADTATPGDKPDTGQESGSEVANNDGPGGHADEPGNPNADHQAQGPE